MEVHWPSLAAKDLERIFKRIQQDNPTASREVAQNICDARC
jgi:plasmid stabilization system protein ParE